MSWESIERQRAYQRAWRATHKEEAAVYQRAWRKAHKEYFKKYKKQWYAKNRTKILARLQAERDLKVAIAKAAVYRIDPQARYLTVTHHSPTDLNDLLCYSVRFLSAVGNTCKLKILLDARTYDVVTTFYSQTMPPGCVGDVIATRGV